MEDGESSYQQTINCLTPMELATSLLPFTHSSPGSSSPASPARKHMKLVTNFENSLIQPELIVGATADTSRSHQNNRAAKTTAANNNDDIDIEETVEE